MRWPDVSDNDNLELKKRSRRRLVGAAALALVAAIVLPMVMDDEPAVNVHDIQVTIPDRDADSRLARPIVGRTPVPVEEPVLAPAPQELLSGEIEEIIEEYESEYVEEPVSAPSRTQETATAVPRAEPPQVPQTPQAPSPTAPAPAPPVAAPSAPTADEAERVRAILEGRAQSAASTGFFVQVGAFSERDKAVAFSDNLKGQGFSSFTESAGPITRVRVGPFASRELAEREAERLRDIGFDGVVTAR